MAASDLLAVELRLDRIEGELAVELPPHMRRFARAYARGAALPPAPDVLHRATTLATARAARGHPALAGRGLALLRLVAPIAIEDDPAVAAARAAAPTWDALAVLAAARDAAAQARFGRPALAVLHDLHGVPDAGGAPGAAAGGEGDGGASGAAGAGEGEGGASGAAGASWAAAGSEGEGGASGAAGASWAAGAGEGDGGASGGEGDGGASGAAAGGEGDGGASGAAAAREGGAIAPVLPPAVPGWSTPDGLALDERMIAAVWDRLRVAHGVAGGVRFERFAGARPRTFVVEPGREVIIVIPPEIGTPADRFAVLHELGHALVALALPAGIPRVLDEAAAAVVARGLEAHGAIPGWHTVAATPARARRLALARHLDRLERALPALPAPGARIAAHPPWALWHDPGAQASYAAAEALADGLVATLAEDRGAPPGALVRALAALRGRIDGAPGEGAEHV